MTFMPRVCSLLLALALSVPVLAPTPARAADEDPTNEIVAYGLLGAVVGILVYLGWQMDKEDRQHKTEAGLRHALASTEEGGGLMLLCPPARAGEQIAGIGYGLDF